MSKFEMLRKKIEQAQKEKISEINKKKKDFTDPDSDQELEAPPLVETNKTIQLRDELKKLFRQARVDTITEKESREKEFEPITQRLDKAEKAVKQTDKDLSKKLDLIPINKKIEPKQLTFTPEEEDEENIEAIIDKGTVVTSKGLGAFASKYMAFQDEIFGIWFDGEKLHIGNSNNVIIDGNDLIINDEKYKGTEGLWVLLTNPKKNKVDKETFDAWWTNKNNFTEEDLSLYKEILKKTHSIYQNNDPSTKMPKSSIGKKWKEIVSKIWKEIKQPKYGSGLIKYNEGPIEYKYIYNLNQLLKRLYFIYAEEKAGNNNYHNEKMGIIKFFYETIRTKCRYVQRY